MSEPFATPSNKNKMHTWKEKQVEFWLSFADLGMYAVNGNIDRHLASPPFSLSRFFNSLYLRAFLVSLSIFYLFFCIKNCTYFCLSFSFFLFQEKSGWVVSVWPSRRLMSSWHGVTTAKDFVHWQPISYVIHKQAEPGRLDLAGANEIQIQLIQTGGKRKESMSAAPGLNVLLVIRERGRCLIW